MRALGAPAIQLKHRQLTRAHPGSHVALGTVHKHSIKSLVVLVTSGGPESATTIWSIGISTARLLPAFILEGESRREETVRGLEPGEKRLVLLYSIARYLVST